MNEISYNYKITSVDAQARCMEVVYTSEGHQTMHISARLPYENETLEAVIQMYAPVAYWVEQTLTCVVPSVGVSGQINVPLAPAEAVQSPVEAEQTFSVGTV